MLDIFDLSHFFEPESKIAMYVATKVLHEARTKT
jgi:hypothetical protein